MMNDQSPKRGMSASYMRAFTCKDCQRDIEGLQDEIATLEASGASKNQIRKLRGTLRTRMEKATYNENWAKNLVERGGSRSDRCKDHRQKHRVNIQGLAVAYIDLKTVGEVADRDNPTGPLGGLGPLPTVHEEVEGTSYNLQEVRVGMTDDHVAEMVEKLREKQVLILKAGTGTGKSTFAPYRLMDPPPSTLTDVPSGAPFAKLTDLGPIIVTEPRVQAAVGVASFVGGVMSGAGGVGPGYPVGYQVSGDRNHDEACDLIYVTDGTMINWLREGRLSRIGTVIVDEAHERSTNIDFIMGYLKRELPRYPHLRVIVTSATFNTDFYLEYFGGPANANVMDVPPEKTFGYGMPFFPNLDTPEDGEDEVLERWTDTALPLSSQTPRDEQSFIRTHWKNQFAEPLQFPEDVSNEADDGYTEDVWQTTRLISDLRFEGKIPTDQWQERMPGEMAKFVIKLARGLDEAGIFGDILGFLPTRRTIEPVCEEIEKVLGRAYKDQVFPLISSLPKDRQKKALAKRRKGDPRKIVISTNLAETSLTVEGVRFVVDSGIIAQSEWDPDLAKGTIPTKPHSQAGIKQRWGRVGRKAPGWVFPLYTKAQFLELAEDTPPGSTRDNLEALVMTAKMGGIDDVLSFDWPASFQPTTIVLDEKATQARELFIRELHRADEALRTGGAVDNEGHPTSFGKELVRFQGLGSTASALAILYADRLACVPEVATVIALLEDTRLIGQRGLLLDDFDWPDEWRLEAAERHRGFASVCEDEAELVLLIAAAWERADSELPPWEHSPAREDWARRWWVNHAILLEAAKKRQDVLAALAPAMKEEVKRFVEPALINRARGVLTRAMAANIFIGGEGGHYQPASTLKVAPSAEESPTEVTSPLDADEPASAPAPVAAPATSRVFRLEEDSLLKPRSEHVVALRRRESKLDNRISSLVIAQDWAMTQPDEQQPSSVVDAMRMLIAASKYAPAEAAKNVALQYIENWPVGQRVKLELESVGGITRARALTSPVPPFPRPKTREERGQNPIRRRTAPVRSKVTPGEEDTTGAPDDVKTDIRLTPRRGYDDEGAWQAELLEADRETGTLQACGQCFPCRDDRPEDCERQSSPPEPGRREDLVATWLATARAGTDVSTPRVEVDREYPIDSDGWYEVTGYLRGEDTFVVTVRPDWRRGKVGSAGQHPDLKAGDPIEVNVGQSLRHHGGSLRAFDRLDGKGRFILAEARGRYDDEQVRRREIAVSLDRGNVLLLESLVPGSLVKATVVPARAEGTLTITLLELLHQHWSKAQLGRGVRNEILDKSRRNRYHEKVYTALVESPPNPNGYVTARLLHQDSAVGILHRFDFNVKPTQNQSTDQSEPPGDTDAPGETRPLDVGDPIMLKLGSDRTSLDVSGLSVDKLRDIESHQAGQIIIDGMPNDENWGQPYRSKARQKNRAQSPSGAQKGTNGRQAQDDDDEEVLAPPGTRVLAKTEKPLSRSAAAALVGLSDEPDWPNEVWSFWARTHHLRVDNRTPFIPGTLTEPFEVQASVHIEETTPLAQQQARMTAFTTQYPVHSVLECIVKSLSNGGAFVDLEGGIEGFIPTQELSWGNRLRHPDQVVTVGDSLLAVLLEVPEPPGKPTLSVKALKPDPFEAFKNRFPPGARISGTINGRIEHAVFVDLGNDVDGSIHISELEHLRLRTAADFSEIGATVEAEVVRFDDKARKVVLSRKKTLPHPYHEYKARHAIGDKVEVRIVRANRTHVYVEHSNGATGAVFAKNLAHGGVDDASTAVVIGEKLTAQIIEFKDERLQVELSVKALLPEPYSAIRSTMPVGISVTAMVTGLNDSFAYVMLPGAVSGSIHVSQLSPTRVDKPADVLHKGQSVAATVIGFDDQRKQVKLSLRQSSSTPMQSMPPGTTPAPTTSRTAPARTPVKPPPRSMVAEGDTVEAALADACRQLGVSTASITYEVLDQGEKKRLFRSGRPARVLVRER
ncbi:S1 RNA-binding domain-containing protein [Paenarthrobacter ureafaciens]|uniref:S1 RNA-binding domain-containing protein n=1 Tax=Paenarthrobacter ureafaciens TaxID=37931 RepID=UPI001FB4901D|nr:S1 RNA-binding domain-containing protein [Paenarthrobacter ureafaciens]UOD83521.1 S1 RNA-binding domain-containing protein [Paenarthrobacter ureafaciens]